MNCDYLDAVFASGEMIWIARVLFVTAAIVLMATAAFVVASALVHMRRGRWLMRAGTFEVSEDELRDGTDDRAGSDHASKDVYDELTELRVRLAISSELLEKIQRDWFR